ncbi:MAG: arabinose ABC transporter permease, partial [Rhodococcus sp. (in: high G+C Gram-positive bacteria)]
FIAVWLVDRFSATAVIVYLVITMSITVIAVATSRETKGVDLDKLEKLY